MYSLIKKFPVRTENTNRLVTVTAVRIANDINGNPRYKVQVWSHILDDITKGCIWSPKVKGYRRSKDDTYILKSVYNLDESLDEFMKVFEESINE